MMKIFLDNRGHHSRLLYQKNPDILLQITHFFMFHRKRKSNGFCKTWELVNTTFNSSKIVFKEVFDHNLSFSKSNIRTYLFIWSITNLNTAMLSYELEWHTTSHVCMFLSIIIVVFSAITAVSLLEDTIKFTLCVVLC